MDNLYRIVLHHLKTNEKKYLDITKQRALLKLNRNFKAKTLEEQEVILLAYTDWRDIYVGKVLEYKKVRDTTYSFRCTKEEKEKIKEKLGNRRIEDILLGVLDNE